MCPNSPLKVGSSSWKASRKAAEGRPGQRSGVGGLTAVWPSLHPAQTPRAPALLQACTNGPPVYTAAYSSRTLHSICLLLTPVPSKTELVFSSTLHQIGHGGHALLSLGLSFLTPACWTLGRLFLYICLQL